MGVFKQESAKKTPFFNMVDFKTRLLTSEGTITERHYTFPLPVKSTIADAKLAFTQKEGYTPERIALYFKPQVGNFLPVNDPELVEDIIKDYGEGEFVIECPHLMFSMGMSPSLKILFNPKVWVCWLDP